MYQTEKMTNASVRRNFTKKKIF